MAVSKDQALNALFDLKECHERALIIYYLGSHKAELTPYHEAELEKHFARAAAVLGYKLVKIEDNQLHVMAAAEEE